MTDALLGYQTDLNEELKNLALTQEPQKLYEPIRYILDLGGKRFRPMLVLLAYDMCKKKEETASILKAAAAVEVFHNFTLMHDDIMDNAPLRRGQPTVHERWSNNVAILSGDVMLVKAYELISQAADVQYLAESLRLFNRCAAQVCEGQQWDMNFENRETVSEKEYLEMIRLKTAVLLGFSLRYGALLAGAPKTQQKELEHFGELMGVGFQLKDDLLDAYGEPTKVGKQVGGDIIANKKTFLVIKTLELADEKDAEQFKAYMGTEKMEPQEKVKKVMDLFDKYDIKAQTEIKIKGYFDKALAILDSLEGSAEKKRPLLRLTQTLISRQK